MKPTQMLGKRYGSLIVAARSDIKPHGKVHWLCKCDCGTEKVICGSSLRSGNTRSCGCGIGESNKRRSRHGMTRTPEHKAWRQMIARCTCATNPGFKHYGQRGISVSPEWIASFEAFFADVGPRPTDAHSLERDDTNGNYEPGNVRWATASEQARNTRRSRRWSVKGLMFETSDEAAAHFGVNQSTIVRWCSEERALADCKSTPIYEATS
jgi:hypothetical protein